MHDIRGTLFDHIYADLGIQDFIMKMATAVEHPEQNILIHDLIAKKFAGCSGAPDDLIKMYKLTSCPKQYNILFSCKL